LHPGVRLVMPAGEAVRAQNDVRATLLQGLGGLAVLCGAYFTWCQLQTSREQLHHNLKATQDQLNATWKQLALAQEGQLTDRFTRAVDQLGSRQLTVRLGGIYALERIARASSPDRETIAQVLTAFVRETAPWRLPDPAPSNVDRSPPSKDKTFALLQTRAPDVEWALVVLGRTVLSGQQNKRLRLNLVDLRGANLEQLHFETMDFAYSHLEGAWLRGTHLERSWLVAADLREADLAGAHLAGARLYRADLTNAHNLDRADLAGARADAATRWPAGFDPAGAGIVIESRDTLE